MFTDIKKLFDRRGLILQMVYKDLTDRYAGSSMGIFLSVLQPLLLIAVYTVVFTFVFKVRVNSSDRPIDYAFYAICGLIPWLAVSEGISKSVGSVLSRTSIVKQAIFPTEILPVSTVLSTYWALIVSIVIYLIGVAIFIPSHLSWYILLLPLIIFFQALFSIGLGWLLAILGVYFRDIGELVGILLMVGMFVTPILYLEDMIPPAFSGIMKLNPFAHLIYMYRDSLFYGRILHPWSFVIFGVLSIIVFFAGFSAFKKVKHLFANVL